jgi:hypothetical protein
LEETLGKVHLLSLDRVSYVILAENYDAVSCFDCDRRVNESEEILLNPDAASANDSP